MIIIDGRESNVSVASCASLGEVLTKLMEEEALDSRIVTDVFLNKEAFSELYPYQAEDIDAVDIQHLELRTVSLDEMATNVVEELPKVITIMASASREIAGLLRRSELADAFEMLQDMIIMNRDFLSTVQVLRGQYATDKNSDLDALGDSLGALLGEIADTISNEDWVLVADLLEYEYIPACDGWHTVIASLSGDIVSAEAS